MGLTPHVAGNNIYNNIADNNIFLAKKGEPLNYNYIYIYKEEMLVNVPAKKHKVNINRKVF